MEKTIDRQTLLSHTLWGVDIYAHILRMFYPDETVIKVTGRDCGICRNPFAGGGKTLHIWFARTIPQQNSATKPHSTTMILALFPMETHLTSPHSSTAKQDKSF